MVGNAKKIIGVTKKSQVHRKYKKIERIHINININIPTNDNGLNPCESSADTVALNINLGIPPWFISNIAFASPLHFIFFHSIRKTTLAFVEILFNYETHTS